jgi:hypothetical protein
MDSNEANQLLTALRLHFTSPSYDYFKFNGKLKYALKDISTRRDKFQIQKIAKHPDPMGLIVANLCKDPGLKWAGDFITDEAYAIYRSFVRRRDSLSYTYTQEIKKLGPTLADAFKLTDNGTQHPLALRLYLGDHICLETLVIADDLIGFYPYWDKKLADDPIWKSIRLVIPKYRPFLQYDKAKFKEITKVEFARR